MTTLTFTSPPTAYRRASLWVSAMHLCLLVVIIGWSNLPKDDFTPPVMMGQMVDLQSEQLKEKVVLRHAVETHQQPPQQRTTQPKSDSGTVQAAKVSNERPSGEVSAPLHLPNANAPGLSNPKPPYPAISQEAGEQGRVYLWVCVSEAGAAESVDLRQSSGFKRLDDSALAAVRRWHFIPANRAGVPVRHCYERVIHFEHKGRRDD